MTDLLMNLITCSMISISDFKHLTFSGQFVDNFQVTSTSLSPKRNLVFSRAFKIYNLTDYNTYHDQHEPEYKCFVSVRADAEAP